MTTLPRLELSASPGGVELTPELWDSTPVPVQRYILGLATMIVGLTTRVEELEERIRTNSSNSSKPPSSDMPGQGPRKSPRNKKSKRKRGGQPGHPGTSRKLLPPDKVDAVVDCRPERCGDCGDTSLLIDEASPDPRQVWELPEIVPSVTEYRSYWGRCSRCGTTTGGQVPSNVGPGMLGPRAMAAVAMLSGQFHLSKRAVAQVFDDMFGLDICEATVSATEERVIAALAEPVEKARAHVQTQEVASADESGWYVGVSRSRAWLWTAIAGTVAVFLMRASRGAEVAKELLLASCQLHGIEPYAYLRDLFCLLPTWSQTRLLELSPAEWTATSARLDVQATLAANPFRAATLAPNAQPPISGRPTTLSTVAQQRSSSNGYHDTTSVYA